MTLLKVSPSRHATLFVQLVVQWLYWLGYPTFHCQGKSINEHVEYFSARWHSFMSV